MGPISRPLGVLATMLGDSRAPSERIGAPPHVARTHADHARVLLARRPPGDAQEAGHRLTSATALAQQLGMRGLLAEIEVMARESLL